VRRCRQRYTCHDNGIVERYNLADLYGAREFLSANTSSE
jgi:hypothetical protein